MINIKRPIVRLFDYLVDLETNQVQHIRQIVSNRWPFAAYNRLTHIQNKTKNHHPYKLLRLC